jgi:hypothetical protein
MKSNLSDSQKNQLQEMLLKAGFKVMVVFEICSRRSIPIQWFTAIINCTPGYVSQLKKKNKINVEYPMPHIVDGAFDKDTGQRMIVLDNLSFQLIQKQLR